MKFKIDENLPVAVATLLQRAGIEALTVSDQHLEGKSDAELITACNTEDRVLVTLDTGFADIVNYLPKQYRGLIVLRVKQQDKPHVLAIINRLIPVTADQSLAGQLWIVEEDRIRIRR